MGESSRALVMVHAAPGKHPRGFCRVPVGLHYRPLRARGSNRQPKQASFFSSLLPGPLPPNRRSARFSRGFCAVLSAWLETMKDRAHRPSQDHRRRAVWRWDSCRTRRSGCGSNRRSRSGLHGSLGGEVRDPPNQLPTATPLSPTPRTAGCGTAGGASRRASPKRDWLSSEHRVIEVARGTDGK